MNAHTTAGSSPIVISAAAALALLTVALGWQLGASAPDTIHAETGEGSEEALETNRALVNPNWREELAEAGVLETPEEYLIATEGEVPYTDAAFSELLGSYIAMKQNDTYTDEAAAFVAGDIAHSVAPPVDFTPFLPDDLRTTDASAEARERYRAELTAVLEPLMSFEEPEFFAYAKYLETGEEEHLGNMQTYAAAYKQAAEDVAVVAVPEDAITLHLHLANALAAYGASLESLARFADDPLASIALLSVYDSAERQVFASFGAFASYFPAL